MTISYDGMSNLPEEFFAYISTERRLEAQAQRLQERAAQLYNIPYALSCVNSTAALHLAMCALDLKRGDKVICSVNAYVDIPEVVRHFDAEPIFVDCDPFSYNIDPNRLEEALKANRSKKLRAIVVNHMAGLPADMEEIYDLAKRYGVKVVEDLSDSPLLMHNGRILGTDERTIISVASIGDKMDGRFDAGLMLSRNKECYERGELLRDHAMLRENRNASYLYDIVDIGCQYRLDEYSAIYARFLLERLEKENSRKKEIAEFYFNELDGLEHLRLPLRKQEHSYFRFIVEIDKNRDAFARKLAQRGVEVKVHYVPLHSTRYYKDKYDFKLFDFPWAMGVYQRAISLPNRPDLSDEELHYICDAIRQIDAEHI